MSVPIPNNEKTQHDPFYRYKRDSVVISDHKLYSEWTNANTILNQLKCDKIHFKKHLRKVLNQQITDTKTGFKFKSLCINLEEFLEAYICKYVICIICGIPEMNWIDKKCRACGHVTKL
jgi:translation initiation factor 2 beta subunit (eIF-2beta)/eIF-5